MRNHEMIAIEMISINQNDSNGNRTRVTAVKGRCLNRLTMEPCRLVHRAALFSARGNSNVCYDTIFHRF